MVQAVILSSLLAACVALCLLLASRLRGALASPLRRAQGSTDRRDGFGGVREVSANPVPTLPMAGAAPSPRVEVALPARPPRPVETPPAGTMPAETMPAETMHAQTLPAQTLPAQTMPAARTPMRSSGSTGTGSTGTGSTGTGSTGTGSTGTGGARNNGFARFTGPSAIQPRASGRAPDAAPART